MDKFISRLNSCIFFRTDDYFFERITWAIWTNDHIFKRIAWLFKWMKTFSEWISSVVWMDEDFFKWIAAAVWMAGNFSERMIQSIWMALDRSWMDNTRMASKQFLVVQTDSHSEHFHVRGHKCHSWKSVVIIVVLMI